MDLPSGRGSGIPLVAGREGPRSRPDEPRLRSVRLQPLGLLVPWLGCFLTRLRIRHPPTSFSQNLRRIKGATEIWLPPIPVMAGACRVLTPPPEKPAPRQPATRQVSHARPRSCNPGHVSRDPVFGLRARAAKTPALQVPGPGPSRFRGCSPRPCPVCRDFTCLPCGGERRPCAGGRGSRGKTGARPSRGRRYRGPGRSP